MKSESGLSHILRNISWLFADRVLKMFLALFVGAWVARYLGPEQFGMLSYAQALVALVSPFALLGLKSIVVRQLVLDEKSASEIIGTGFVLMCLSAFLGVIATCVAAFILRGEDKFFLLIIFVWSLSLLFKPSEVVKYWFVYKVRSKPTVQIELLVVAISAAVKVMFILNGITLRWFAVLHTIEALMLAIGLLILYSRKVGSPHSWNFVSGRAQTLVSESWPLVLSGVAVVVYMQVDKVMLGAMMEDVSVGLYAAASRLSVVWNFIPTAVAASVFPSILRAKSSDSVEYVRRIQGLLSGLAGLAWGMAFFIWATAEFIVGLLFGPEYARSAEVLAVHIWGSVFAFLGVGGSQWFLAEQLQKLIFYRTFGGAILNVVLNVIWIPKYGLVGAAWATLFSQLLASVLFNCILPKTRELFRMQMRALFLLDIKDFYLLLRNRKKTAQ